MRRYYHAIATGGWIVGMYGPEPSLLWRDLFLRKLHVNK
jgi:hypothetical protein